MNDELFAKLAPGLIIDEGCWGWKGSHNERGYGIVRLKERRFRVHKVMYEWVNGPVPAGFELDHLCKNEGCWRIDHLEQVTHAENIRRGTWGHVLHQRRREQTHCVHGHEYTPENTIIRKRGWRKCRTCARQQDRDRKRRMRADG